MFATRTASFPVPVNLMNSASAVKWKTQYDGRLVVAYLDGKAIAGISGPWADEFALTWWHLPPALRRLEIYASLDDAKNVVELWSRRMQNVVGELHVDDCAPSESAAAIH
jgi:hypothetical protein